MVWESLLLDTSEGTPDDGGNQASTLALGTFGGPRRELIVGDISLTLPEFMLYRSALEELHRLEERPTFQMVEHNFRELTALRRHYEDFFSEGRGRYAETGDAGFAMMVAITNWLTSVRLFLDHQQTDYMRRHGPESPQLSRFKDACAAEFDASLGYRFTYKLRNYVQHCGLPLSSTYLRLSVPGESGSQRIDFQLHRDDLLESFDAWGPVKADLEKLPRKFLLLPLVTDAMQALRRVAKEVFRIDVEFALMSVPTIREALNRLGNRAGHGALMVFTPNPDGTTELSFAHLPDANALARVEALIANGGDALTLVEAPLSPAD